MGYRTDCDDCGRAISMAARYCQWCGAKQSHETRFDRVAYWARRLAGR